MYLISLNVACNLINYKMYKFLMKVYGSYVITALKTMLLIALSIWKNNLNVLLNLFKCYSELKYINYGNILFKKYFKHFLE